MTDDIMTNYPTGKLGAAVIGAGTFGEIHARAYAECPQCELLYICDREPDVAQRMAEAYQVIGTSSTDEIMSDGRVSVVSIATPDFAHFEPVMQAIAAGKHILCEKPLATSLQEARHIFLAAEQSKVNLMVDFHNRFNPACVEVKRRLQNLGPLVHGSICLNNNISVPTSMLSWASQSGPQWFLMPHVVDLARWYTDAEPVAVTGAMREGTLKERGINAPDVFQAVLEFENCNIFVESSWVLPASWPSLIEFEAKLNCTNGRAGFSLHNQGVEVYHEGLKFPFLAGKYETHNQSTGFFELPIRHFIQCILQNEPPETDCRDGLMVTMIIEAIVKSAHEKRRVELAELIHPSEQEIETMEEESDLLE